MTDVLDSSVTTDVTYRLATPYDLPDIMHLFTQMLLELAKVSHDVLPTERNLVVFSDQVFAPALERDEHGIVLAESGLDAIGATFFTPEFVVLESKGKRAVAHGIYVEPHTRNQGIARHLQAIAHARLQDLGYTSLVSVVMEHNKAGLASAQAAGARVVGYYTSVDLKGDY